MVQIINNHQTWPSLQQTPFNKCQSETANHRPGKPDKLSQHASAKTQAIIACKVQTSYPSTHSKGHCIKGAARGQNSGIAETVEIAVGVRRAQY